jgi:hypothetical protein
MAKPDMLTESEKQLWRLINRQDAPQADEKNDGMAR